MNFATPSAAPAPRLPDGFADSGLFLRAGPVPPTRVQVMGERSSGTNFLKRLIGRNTPLTPTEELGWKHGAPAIIAIPADLLVVVAVRNAADWARSMHAKPWHASPALQALDFPAFLRAEWDTIADRPRYFEGLPDSAIGQPLQPDRDPLTGARHADLFALRRAKLTAHLSLLNRDCALAVVRMETATAAPEALLAQLRATYAWPDAPYRPVHKRLGAKFKPAIPDRPATPEWSEDDLAHLRARVDMAQEAMLGYSY
ncbi:hypothetical protein [Pseudooceanicola nanhaiensis]|uniref:hypothetical protein n=1 Tax=Pseudooceanicola nanhaiensis TaxID=375761 RepID=UPI001CD4E2BE|nr:hypothetical protein [Pseudooceanicola nanhaiensis]MCA0920977.1 hypothetical protein [Pseudooceanicola nanhaiensis]